MPSDPKSLDDLSLPDDISIPSGGNASYPSDDEEGQSGQSSHSASRSDSGHSSTDNHTAEALVKRENRTVNISRVVVILILIGATIATAYSVFRFTRDGEEEAYDNAFHNVASKLTSSLVSDMSLKFWMARTISDATAMMLKTAVCKSCEICEQLQQPYTHAPQNSCDYLKAIAMNFVLLGLRDSLCVHAVEGR
ncbi:hypothetical protein IV203_001680 [Nitzschia inconspicua]|uniref:Transmembrane protein n=1 Tax=Nitzschia inconspicua TaxID=303405 RepID=A0A9K3L7D7_9STRA|nr:hypothetical protein IV203_001680 [Nitzschia inconspicua]